MTIARERTWWFSVDASFDPGCLAEVAHRAGGTYEAAIPRRVQTDFADTSGLRLLRWGTLLVRVGGEGWQVIADGLDVPLEGSDVDVPADARDLLCAQAGSEDLAVRVRTRAVRRGGVMVSEDGAAIATIQVDEVTVIESRSVPPPFGVLRLTVSPGTGSKLKRGLRKALVDAGATEVDPLWVLRTALGPVGESLRPVVTVPELADDPSVAAVLGRAVAASVVRFVRADPVARVGEDPEGVHQLRVACRRLRSDLRTFGDYVDPQWAEALRAELHWLGSTTLGPVRDADVMAQRLAQMVGHLDDDDRDGSAALLARIEADRLAARASLLEAMRSDRYRHMVELLLDAAAHPALSDGAEVPMRDVAKGLVPYRPLRRSVRALGPDSVFADYHKVRIRAKRCRYAVEAISPAFGKDAARFAKRLAALQVTLGDYCDAVVMARWLRTAAADADATRDEAFEAGVLAGEQHARAEALLEQWPDVWHRASRKKLRAFLG